MIVKIQAAISATVAILVGSSLKNAVETYSVFREKQLSDEWKEKRGLLQMSSKFKESNTNVRAVVQNLQAMNRKDLLRVYQSCECPDFDVTGEWDGKLLENGLVMTKIASFVTNRLFGGGNNWNGKYFGNNSVGGNRFVSQERDVGGIVNDEMARNIIVKDHSFDYALLPSPIDRGKNSLVIKYARYHSSFSLFNSMVDELRVLKYPDSKGNGAILIGLGSMAWSGGKLNCSPFCLMRTEKDD